MINNNNENKNENKNENENVEKNKSIKNNIITISGQPVTGKTTTVNAIVKNIEEKYPDKKIHVINTGDQFRAYMNAVVDICKNINDSNKMNELKQQKEVQDIISNPKYFNALKSSYVNLRLNLKEDEIDKIEISLANSLKELKPIRAVIDKLIDSNIKDMGKQINLEERPDDIYIVDSRLAFHNIPESLKVRLVCDKNVAGKRTFGRTETEKYDSLEEATNAREKRRLGEQIRYKQRYNIDLEDENNYDLIIDTSYAEPEDTSDIILKSLNCKRLGNKFSKYWVSPETLLPIQSIADTAENFNGVVNSINTKGYHMHPVCAIDFIEVDGVKYIIEGHHRNFAAILNNMSLVPVNCVGKDDEPLKGYRGNTRDRAESVKLSNVYDHEDIMKRYKYSDVYGDDIYKTISSIENSGQPR